MGFLKNFWMSIAICLAILYLCFMNTSGLPKVAISNFDKLVHLIMFLGVSLVVYFENTHYLKKPIAAKRIFCSSFLIPVLYSGSIELIQEYFSPMRTGDWMDFLFDGIGAFLGLIICLLTNRKLRITYSSE